VLKDTRLKVLASGNGGSHYRTVSAYEALKNPGLKFGDYPVYGELEVRFGAALVNSVINEIRYEGYILRQDRRVERSRRLEDFALPRHLDFAKLKGLKKEAVQKLSQFQPETLGQASRISGVSPGDITVLMVHLHR
jgi:tRNA uridine 5-carboxymethylaminomethyl modification enzyme